MGAGTKAFPHMTSIQFYCALACLMIFSRGLGELARKLKQPAVLGEILAGIILGKTVLNRVWPAAWNFMFGPGLQATSIQAMSSLASTLFMLVAGMEMDLDRILANKRKPFTVGFFSVLVPFVWGFGITYANPSAMGATPNADALNYAFFAGTAMAITAMPVVAKTLRDVGLYRAKLGQVVMASATIDDLIGWSLFAFVLAVANPDDNVIPGLGTAGVVGISAVYVFAIVIFGKLAFPRFFLWIQATCSFPGGILGFIISWTYTSACIGKLFGLHNTLGAFLVGASISNNRYLRSTTKETIDDFVSYCFAPLFFGYIAVSADFIADFDVALVALVLTIACVGKFMGASFGAKITGETWRESFALATCMNSRGAMEILLANVALSAGVIDGRMFVALVFMAIVTSLMPGPVLRRVLRRKERKVFTSYMPNPHGFLPDLKATDVESAILEMCLAVKEMDAAPLLIEQERLAPTGNHDQLAISTLQYSRIKRTKIILGISKTGIDFSGQLGASGEKPQVSNIIIIVLFPTIVKKSVDVTLENDLIQQICLVFGRQSFRNEFVQAKRYLEVLQLINMETYHLGLMSTQEQGVHVSSRAAAATNPARKNGKPDDTSDESSDHPRVGASGFQGDIEAQRPASSADDADENNRKGGGKPPASFAFLDTSAEASQTAPRGVSSPTYPGIAAQPVSPRATPLNLEQRLERVDSEPRPSTLQRQSSSSRQVALV